MLFLVSNLQKMSSDNVKLDIAIRETSGGYFVTMVSKSMKNNKYHVKNKKELLELLDKAIQE